MDNQIYQEILKLYEKYLNFRCKIIIISSRKCGAWKRNSATNLVHFLLLPDPAKDADFFMMNASSDGFIEPDLSSKQKYLAMMQESYQKLKNTIR